MTLLLNFPRRGILCLITLFEKGMQMIHVVKLLKRRFPNHGSRIVSSLVALSASALVLGMGLLLLK
jgi:hypothetical protein